MKNIKNIVNILKDKYKDFSHYNKKNPLNELLFIMCSTRTKERGYKNSYKELRRRFPTNSSLLNANVRSLSKALRLGGLSKKKSDYIYKIIDKITCDFGDLTLSPLKKLTDSQCENYLCTLTGVGKKTARCVMMYSLDREVFPVDKHCWRIALRIGWLKSRWEKDRISPADEDRLQELIPREYRYSLHVNFISLGREYCTSKKPKCDLCPIARYCKKIGVKN